MQYLRWFIVFSSWSVDRSCNLFLRFHVDFALSFLKLEELGVLIRGLVESQLYAYGMGYVGRQCVCVCVCESVCVSVQCVCGVFSVYKKKEHY